MLDLRELADLVAEHGDVLDAQVRQFEIGGRRFDGHPAVDLMGVVNLSPDSWYRESVCLTVDTAIQRGLRLFAEGAAIVDIGAESTLPEAEQVDGNGQLQRLLPVIEGLAGNPGGGLVSVECYDLNVAEQCLQAGAKIVNLTAAGDSESFYRLAQDYGAGVVACYVQGGEHVRAVGDFVLAEDHVGVLREYFSREAEKAERVGLEGLWFDAGLGFYYKNLSDSAQRVAYQMRTFLQSFRLRDLGWPICQALPHAFEYFADEVRCAEPFFAVLASFGRIDLIRTHEVSRVQGVLKTLAAYEGEKSDA
jgi:dihydropteroate synthase